MAEAVAGAAVQVLVKNLLSMLSGTIDLVRGFDEDLEKLKHALSMTQAFLSDAEDKEIKNKAAKMWLKKLEDVAFEADNVLDEINYHLLRKKLKSKKQGTEKVSSSSSSDSISLLFRQKMAPKINNLNKKLEVINNDANSKGLVMRAPNASAVGVVETDSFAVEPNLVGRKNDIEKLVEMALNTPLDEKISIIPIVGMGGLGKTAVAQQVFHDKRITSHFQKRMWVCVSFDFDELTLFQMVLKTLTGKDIQGIVTKEVVLQNIHEDLASKKYLIILDDVWNQDSKKWEDFMKSLLGISNVSQNVMIVTTREKNVVSFAKTLSPFKLMSLTIDDCWSIIKNKALSIIDDPVEYEETGKCIAKICRGLPLAANVIGGLLRGKPKEEWSSILKNQLSNFGQHDDDHVMKILKLSYNRLPSSSLKRCFAYCAIFPQDYKINKETLVKQWLAEGFLQTNQETDHLENIGYNFFNHLLHASLFQESKSDFGDMYYTMHDLVHDLACSVSGYRSPTKDSGNDMNKVRYLYQNSHEPYHISKERAEYLRTLILTGKVADKMFSGFRSLHVLKVNSSIEKLPVEIVKQIHMRFLDISHTKIIKLPDSINKLSNLQTLVATNLKSLPNTIIDLLHLRHLHISPITLPPFTGKLTSLRTLRYYKVGHDFGCRIGELKTLTNLEGILEIHNLERVKDKEEATQANLFGKSNISTLVLMWEISREGDWNGENVLEGLQPHPDLKSLRILGYESINFPLWTMKMTVYDAIEGRWANLTNLLNIRIHDCQCEKIPNLGQLPCLKTLSLSHMPGVKSIGLSFYGLKDFSTSNVIDNVTVFPALKEFFLRNMPKLVEWVDVESSVTIFPCLENLEIESCPRLKSAPTRFPRLKNLGIEEMSSNVSLASICTNTSSLQTLKSSSGIIHLRDALFAKNRDLSSLEITDCHEITGSSESPEDLIPLQSLKEFHITGCPKLKSIPNCDLSSLRQLLIINCPALTCLERELLESCTHTLDALALIGLPNMENMDVVMSCISKMSRLEILILTGLPILTKFPTDIDCLSSLWSLEIGGFPVLLDVVTFNDYLKQILYRSHHLRLLSLHGNEEWGSLPDLIQHLSSLESLYIYDFGIEALPESIDNLTSLRFLGIWNCKNLKHLPSRKSMQQLTTLRLSKCPLLAKRFRTQQESSPDEDSEWHKISHITYVEVDDKQLPTRNSTDQAHVQDEKNFSGCFPIPRIRRP